jgi:hypothetical protein
VSDPSSKTRINITWEPEVLVLVQGSKCEVSHRFPENPLQLKEITVRRSSKSLIL